MAASFLLLVDGVSDVLLVNGIDFLLLAQSTDDVVTTGGGGGVALSRKKLRKLLQDFEDERRAEQKRQREATFKRAARSLPTVAPQFIDQIDVETARVGKTVIAVVPANQIKPNDDEEAIMLLLLDA